MAYWSGRMAEYGGRDLPFGRWLPAVVFCVIFLCVMYLAGPIAVEGVGAAGLRRAAPDFHTRESEREMGLLCFYGPLSLISGCLILAFFLAGFGRMAWELRKEPLELLLEESGSLNGAKAEGVIERVKEKDGMYSLTLSGAEVTADERVFEGQRVYVTVDGGRIKGGEAERAEDAESAEKAERAGAEERRADGPELMEGKRICVEGKLEAFQEARNPGEFNYRLYYRGLKLRCRLRGEQAYVAGGRPSPFRSQVSRFRSFAKEALEELCGGEDVGVFSAILLGDKSELSEELSDLFSDSGIAHILAVSGLHVSLIGMSLYGGLRKAGLGYGRAGLTAAAVLFFYGAVTGFGPSVFRAVFMVFCAFLAAWLGRTYDLLSAMALSLLLLAADAPFLLFTGGLQLSYGAVAAIGLENIRARRAEANGRAEVHDRTEAQKRDAGQENMPGRLAAALRMSLVIQLATLPMILYHFFRFPVWGIALNLIVIPLMSYAAGSGILAVALYGVWKLFPASCFRYLAFGLIGPGHYIFLFYRILCGITQRLPLSSLAAGRPELWKIFVYYLILAWLYGGEGEDRWRVKRVKKAAACAAAVLFLCIRPMHGLEVWFLDVGQGDGVWIQTRDAGILSDCGSSQYRNVGRDRLLPFLESRGIGRIDYILVSHGDSDHINGITWLLEEQTEIRVGCLVMPQPGEGGELYETLESLAEARGIPVWYMQSGEQITAGELTLSCLHPEGSREAGGREEGAAQPAGAETNSPPRAADSDRNGHSLVFSLRYGGYSMLLTGDIGVEQEEKLIRGEAPGGNPAPLQTTVLKAAHHGSATSTGEAFLQAAGPEIAILSYGAGNTYGHPSGEVVERLERQGVSVWRTAVSGAIRIQTDGRRVKIRGFLPKRVDRKGGDGL